MRMPTASAAKILKKWQDAPETAEANSARICATFAGSRKDPLWRLGQISNYELGAWVLPAVRARRTAAVVK